MTNTTEQNLTPMMRQWQEAKDQEKDAILLFRMGDFYELFGQDAITAAPILELTLTSRDKDKSDFKMAGFPHHAAEAYVLKLIDKGLKVAICEQLEDPKGKKGVVKRGIVSVITPATALINDSPVSEPNFFLAIVSDEAGTALCALDVLTAQFLVTSSVLKDKIIDEAIRFAPKEIVVIGDDDRALEIGLAVKAYLSRFKPVSVEIKNRPSKSHETRINHIFLSDLEKLACGLALSYVEKLHADLLTHITAPKRYLIEDQLLMDEATRLNLDLFPKRRGDKNNLLVNLDETKTAMGRRALHMAINSPSTSKEQIEERQQLVEELLNDKKSCEWLRERLASCYDLEKLTALASAKRLSPRGMARLRDSLGCIAHVKDELLKNGLGLLHAHLSKAPDLSDLHESLAGALADEPPLTLKEGGIFKEGFDSELDALKRLLTNGQELLLELERREREATLIPSLKIRYTRVFGYYLEVTRTHIDKVPSRYQRRQTVANGERYITSELSELEIKLSSAEGDVALLEESLFLKLRQVICERGAMLIELAHAIALLDLVASFAYTAAKRSFVRPKLSDRAECLMDITGGRHPIAEDVALSKNGYFVPNDVFLHPDHPVMLITGPNMAGKSTVMRMAALIQIMAQMGSYVPAQSARLSICDAVFARVGASDDLSLGRSTFMVEMSETAAILNSATRASLILLDEIGRGTSTYDGLSLAQAVVEYIHDELRARTLFATHYHELTDLAQSLAGLKNYHVEVTEEPIRFLYTIAEGPSLKSFGIEVARLAGLNPSVLERAREILIALEKRSIAAPTLPQLVSEPQMDLFGEEIKKTSQKHQKIINKIRNLEIERLSPLDALNRLASLKSFLADKT